MRTAHGAETGELRAQRYLVPGAHSFHWDVFHTDTP